MRCQIFFTTKYIEQCCVQQLIIAVGRIILNDDIFQFGQLCIYLIVMTRKDSYIILGGTFTVQSAAYAGKDLLIFILHVFSDLTYIVIEKLEYQKRYFILR